MNFKEAYFVCIRYVDWLAALRYITDNTGAPRDTNFFLFLHLLQSGLRAHVEKFGNEAARLGTTLSLH